MTERKSGDIIEFVGLEVGRQRKGWAMRVRFEITSSDGSVIRFTARVVRDEGETLWVEMPARIRSLPFPPLDGKRFGKFRRSDVVVIQGGQR